MRPEDSAFSRTGSIVLRGELVTLDRPLVMGILNLDPHSFYAGSRSKGIDDSLLRISTMITEGVDILDIGAASSRPGAEIFSPDEEWKRLEDVIKHARCTFPDLPISIDTPYWKVAERAIRLGVDLINDISGGYRDEAMIPGMGQAGIPYICMHMKGTPQTMKSEAQYSNVLEEVVDYFSKRIMVCRRAGIKDLILDPGFGFAKESSHNFMLLNALDHIRSLGCPVLVGISRKKMIYENLGLKPEDALNGTTALHMAALERGADFLRVHDVKEAKECIRLHSLLKGQP